MLIREPMTAQALTALAGDTGPAVDAVKTFYGISAKVGDFDVTASLAAGVLVAVFVVFAALGARQLARRIR